MAGNPASAPQVPPTGTPPADPAAGGNDPAATPAPQQGTQQQQQQPPAPIIMSQEQFDKRFAEKMGAIEKELGIPQGGLKDFVAAQKKAKQPPAPTGETLTGADLKLARMEALMTAGVQSKQIPLLLQHLNISGKTREEIAGSVRALIDLKLLTIEAPAQPGTQPPQGPPSAAQGAGNPGVPGTPAPKRWKKSEIEAMTHEQIMANETEIDKAQKEGRIDYHL